MSLVFQIKSALKGKTLVRSLMNERMRTIRISGNVLDLGGGENPSYLKHLNKENGTRIITVDSDTLKKQHVLLDLEKDDLPYTDNHFDTILAINLLEHIFNHQHVIKEARRVLNEGGRFIGFVPFLVNVHRDPHDYFRYTDEALENILTHSGFTSVRVTPISWGPVAVGYNALVSVLPARLLFFLLPIVYILDRILTAIRPSWKERFPLGYFFEARK